ncbi:hypothetical protein MSG28_004393, partial [Choristoneura fumiferana]
MDHLSQLQRSLEDMKELFSSRMSAFESASKTSQTEDLGIVEEYHAFKVFIWNAVESLQAQMGLVHKTLEQMEMRSDPQFFSCMVFRRQTLRMPLPLFACQRFRNAVWASKKHLKGSGYTLSEFLTSARHAVFVEARRIFGVERSWTSDGRIMVLGQDKTRYRITSLDELRAIPQTRLRLMMLLTLFLKLAAGECWKEHAPGIVSVSDGNLEFASARENWRVLLAHYAGPAALLVVAALLAPALPLA